MRLVIVESPAKAKTIERYLPDDCKVEATMGHIIDLPKSKLGVDIENDFEPQYQIIRGKGPTVKQIKSQAAKAEEVILATDPDREGEAISYHLANYLGMDLNEKNRIEFHEITKDAVQNAMNNKRTVDMNLVDAQQARRVVDRLVGYQISPILWRKLRKGLSAGRVQSVATRIIVDRENEIRNFIAEEYHLIFATLRKPSTKETFTSQLTKMNGKKIEISTTEDARAILDELNTLDFIVAGVKNGTKRKKSAPAFTTSTLQQDANRKLGFTSKRTMSIAQQLYEGVNIKGKGHTGLVTYIRTDSVRISDVAKNAGIAYIAQNFGKEYIGGVKSSKAKGNVQDAHEAIRPTDVFLTPQMLQNDLTKEQLRLYTLIHNRFVASLMSDAKYDTMSVDISAGDYTFHATGQSLTFPGYLKVYNFDDEEDSKLNIPKLDEGEKLDRVKLEDQQKFTQPPPRYNEASLVKALEEQGIGRPSTYASTISTIQQRDYVELEDKKFKPTDLGEAVTKLMVENFTDIVDLKFTAQMEEKLDDIADGDVKWKEVIYDFHEDLNKYLKEADNIERIKIPDEETDEVCEKCGRKMVIKTSRFGTKFLACPGYPECKNTKSIEEKTGVQCPECGNDILVRKSKKGKVFYGCKGYPECNFVSWYRPTDKLCPQCGNMLFLPNGKSKKLFCTSEGCGYKES
ncbi:MAG: type I DNA topoisomerase [Anaerofustis stercorihominis]|nr:type I DNA topoisomerase [Anaerofustis stercorihominis]